MTGGDALECERLGHCWNELEQGKTGVDVARTLAGFLDQCRYVVAGKVEQLLECFRLLLSQQRLLVAQ